MENKKIIPQMPPSYGLKVVYSSRVEEFFEVIKHSINKEAEVLEFVSNKGLMSFIPMPKVLRVELDGRYPPKQASRNLEPVKDEKQTEAKK